MAKLILDDVTNLENTSLITVLNANFTAIEEAVENTVSRDGTSPNTLTAALDANNQRIYNLPEPTADGDAVSLSALETALEGAGIIQGDKGWSPVFSIETDGTRKVLKVVDWQGGEGTEPASGLYVGSTGLVADIASGVDIRGPAGAGTGDLLSTNNLSDLASAATARTNLGVPAISHTQAASTISDSTDVGRTILTAADAAAARTALVLGALALLEYTDLVYTGSSSSNVTYPVGSIVVAEAASDPNRNASATIRLKTGTSSYTTSGSGSILTGTWRARGYTGTGSANNWLFQRTA